MIMFESESESGTVLAATGLETSQYRVEMALAQVSCPQLRGDPQISEFSQHAPGAG
jgi:hypothetical protein